MKNYTFLLLISIFFSACASKVPFTSDLKTEYGLGEKAMKKIQFYTSEQIILVQSGGNSYLKTHEGKVILNTTSNTNRIIIKQYTPCTVERISDSINDKLVLSFEVGENKTLLFGVNQSGTYSLLAKKWEQGDGYLEYDGGYFTAINGGSAVLLVELKKLNQNRCRERTLSGKRL
ncbi:MAG: hypothetical protein Q8O88_03925 [bacterium]|nr:hypothetical protein [bacterium]